MHFGTPVVPEEYTTKNGSLYSILSNLISKSLCAATKNSFSVTVFGN